MKAEQIQARVDAWLQIRLKDGWFHGHPDRHVLLGQWRVCMQHFDADSHAALGLVLAFVRAAWEGSLGRGDDSDDGVELEVVERRPEEGNSVVAVWLGRERLQLNADAPLSACAVLALEGSP